MIFIRDYVTRENYWRIAPLVTTNIVINDSPYIIIFLTWFSSDKPQINRRKLQSIDRYTLYQLPFLNEAINDDQTLNRCKKMVMIYLRCTLFESIWQNKLKWILAYFSLSVNIENASCMDFLHIIPGKALHLVCCYCIFVLPLLLVKSTLAVRNSPKPEQCVYLLRGTIW